MWFWKQPCRHVWYRPKSSRCCCWHRPRCSAKTRRGAGRKLKRDRRWKYVPIRWHLVLERLVVFRESFLSPRRSPFPAPVPFAVCSDYSFAKGMLVSTASAVFAPAVPPHSGCFIQKTWADSPCLTPVCFHSAPVSKLSPTSYVGAAEIERKKYELCVFVPHVHFFSPQCL